MSSKLSIRDVSAGIHGSTIAGRDVNFIIQMVQQTRGQMPPMRNLPALVTTLKQALPYLDPSIKRLLRRSLSK